MKLLIWLVIILAVVVWFKRTLAAARSFGERDQGTGGHSGNAASPRGTQPQAESMLQCAHCGVHFPASEAVSGAGVVYCSHEHKSLSQR